MKNLFILVCFLFGMSVYSQVPSKHSGGVILGSFTADPTGRSEGQIYWNSTSLKFRKYNGTAWSDLVPTGGTQTLQSVTDLGATTTNNITTQGYTSTGTRLGGNLIVNLGDYNTSTNGTQLIINDATKAIELKSSEGMFGYKMFALLNTIWTQRVEFLVNNITGARTIQLPDASGTAALEADSSGFNGNLATTDNTLQEIAQKVDDLVLGSSSSIFEKELTNAENNINVGFTLATTTVVYFNGEAIPSGSWSGVGTAVLNLSLDTKLYDNLKVKN